MQTKNNKVYKHQLSNIIFFNKYSNFNIVSYSLKQFVQSIPQASFSSILTLASYIACKINTLAPPNFENNIHPTKLKQQFQNQTLSLNHLFQPWCDYIVHLVQTNQVYQDNNKICFASEVNQNFIQTILQTGLFKKLENFEIDVFDKPENFSKQLCKKLINKTAKLQKQKKVVGLMWVSKLTLQQDIFHPKIHFPALIQGILYEEGFEMMHFKIPKGHYPTAQQFMKLDIAIISGSSFSINQDIAQIQYFCKRLKQFYIKNSKLKILGLCFGHQAIAKYFGGNVRQIEKRITGLQKIHFNLTQIENLKLSFIKLSNLGGQYVTKNQLQMFQYHIDQVETISQQFTILAESGSCLNQVMISKDKRILSYQFHMEYSPQYIRSYEIRIQLYKPNEVDYVFKKQNIKKVSESKGTAVSYQSLLQMRLMSSNFINSSIQ